MIVQNNRPSTTEPWYVLYKASPHRSPQRSALRQRLVFVFLATALAVGGCANMTTTEQRVLSGAAIGAVGGAAIAAIAATNVATGAAIGAGVGAGAGYLYSRSQREHKTAYHPTKRQQVARTSKPKSQAPAPVTGTNQMLARD